MFTPTFMLPENYKEYIKQKQQASGYCLNCNRPTVRNLCSYCLAQLKLRGLEKKRIPIKLVGDTTINYQQYLHTSFFNCNAPLEYRGLKENRIKIKLNQETITRASKAISNLFSKDTYTYRGKTYKVKTDIHQKYIEIQSTKNLDRRILYYITLYYVCYYIENKHFMSEAHFYSSMIHSTLSEIRGRHYKLTKIKRSYRRTDIMKYHLHLIQQINKLMNPLLIEIVKDRF